MTNCPNCGAPVRRGYSKCEYCDTPYEGVDPLILYADNRPVHIELDASAFPTAEQMATDIQTRLARLQTDVANSYDWERRMLEQTVNAFPRVEFDKAEKADYEMMKKIEHTSLNILLPFMFAILSAVIIPTIIAYFCH